MSKRPGGSLGSIMSKKMNTDKKAAANNPNAGKGGGNSLGRRNPFLSQPIQPERSLATFLMQCRKSARNFLPKETKFPVNKPFCEIEARVGVLKVNDRRVAPSGPKRIQNTIVQAFDCSSLSQNPTMTSGVTRSHYVHWTQSGLSEPGPLTGALGVVPTGKSKEELARTIKNDLVETELVETVFAGYPQERRITVPGYVPMPAVAEFDLPSAGSFEYKEKLKTLDWTLPAAKYDLRVSLASEKIVDSNVRRLPRGWTIHRVKRRRSYSRRDKNMAWQIDVTEVTTTPAPNATTASDKKSVSYEVEMEIMPQAMLSLINKPTDDEAMAFAKSLAQQLWWILGQINPISDVVDVEEYLEDHPSRKDVQLALATCGALKKFMDTTGRQSGVKDPLPFPSPLATPDQLPSAALTNLKFCGCMPVNFSRHNMEDIQQDTNGYFVSEKTDGVRHFMIFTGNSVVLVDRAMRGKRAIPIGKPDGEPMAHVLSLIQPGTVLDGEVVLHRGSSKHKARPVFIVFDVMAISGNLAVSHLPFELRLKHLMKATFRTKTADRDMFDDAYVANMNLPLPLVRKNFVRRTDLVDLLSHVVEEKGLRSYRNGVVHNHLTDGIIFQPNLPYVCGTDVNLLKWKYLDTVTIDVEILPPRPNFRGGTDDDDELRVGVLGEEQTKVDMTRYVRLPAPERLRLEADRVHEPNANIAEVGFDPETGEWYYLTMRPDKVAPNHISTVLGTLLELSESLTESELQYRLSLPAGTRDTYRKDVRGMMSQLLQHQQKKQKSQQQHRK